MTQRKITPKMADRCSELFQYAAAMPDGFTINDASEFLGCSSRALVKVIHNLRMLMGDIDSINLIATPQGMREPWLYRLVGTLDDSKEWSLNRIGDAETRVRTIQAVMSSIQRATDGRTSEGKRVRILTRGLGRVVEDLDELNSIEQR